MNLSRMLDMVGIGCGEICVCRKAFVASLSEDQAGALARMIEKSARLHHEEIVAAAKDDHAINRTGKLSLADLLGAILVGTNSDETMGSEPYPGDLTPKQMEVLSQIEEPYRTSFELRVRQVIHMHAGDKPQLVEVKFIGDELMIGVLNDEEAAA